MKRLWIAISIAVAFLTACTETTPDEQVRALAEKAKKVEYEIADYTKVKDDIQTILERHEKIKPYFTEKEYRSITNNRVMAIATLVATRQKANITVKELTLQPKSEADSARSYDYTIKLELTYPDGRPSKIIEANGQIDFVKESEGWKISRDWDGHVLVKEIDAE
ncbi:hypothetical protein ACTID9_17675 [Brevibacillus fluminis]|uniref:hypothetical protein n=1 Tax=Brevibacillus fluminis TaxID=511487 RepID=UPI003F887F35